MPSKSTQMSFTKEYHCIPDTCRDQHLPMAPRYASPFRDHGIRGLGLHEAAPPYEVRRFDCIQNILAHLVAFSAKKVKLLLNPAQVLQVLKFAVTSAKLC